jgi:hypothetical protein
MNAGGWTLVKPNTISMPVPNLGTSSTTIGGLTNWVSRNFIVGAGATFISLGDGTFIISNFVYDSSGSTNPISVTEIRAGVGVTYPSGRIPAFRYTSGPEIGQFIKWSDYASGNHEHSGHAIRLSGITASTGGNPGGGIQPG